MDGPDNLLETQAGRSALRVTTTAYTKWINAHFKAAGEEELTDLFNDLRDGSKLMTLIEILTGTKLVREKGKTRNHHMINITTVIDFLQSKEKIDLVGITSSGIADGNQTLTLGLIWKLILRYQVLIIT
ncbi:PREDICTED: dystrophin-like, partial [Amphimedon queenslandica]|uniref:Calponin-homology (CH) domain-containing protein n=1 Tax=Amphimedon queenslandica TaxID=400682 RepID=A0AAN0K2G6_AMPQE